MGLRRGWSGEGGIWKSSDLEEQVRLKEACV